MSFFFRKQKYHSLLTEESLNVILHDINEDQQFHPTIHLTTEKNFIKEIKASVQLHNRNNLTRTAAYLKFYEQHPEIQWSFLAHMVSRNAGYHMTDLKSVTTHMLLSEKETKGLFLFLEKANYEIFSDAYVQLLLYEKSLQLDRPLFHLLNAFHVSPFMKKMWSMFWKEKQKKVLTVAMIINEQQMLQTRVLTAEENRNWLQKTILTLHDKLNLTTILFPYQRKKHAPYDLTGLDVHQFANVDHRILTGKSLYSLLFHPKIHNSALQFASKTPHTASRKDYWPHIYKNQVEAHSVHSPPLKEAWQNVTTLPLQKKEWYSANLITKMTYWFALQQKTPKNKSNSQRKIAKWQKALQTTFLR
ncbi:DUF2515 family protein [Bacillus sp. 2205SS5-2]|uniref:DUF2515 family protein n=1 Tax=Bacillus sp. 2205SS5-2 TaxID=3109031 RepID=UPI003003FFE8